MKDIFQQKMESGLKELELTLTQHQMDQFYDYYQFLIEWNKVMNLTAITEIDDVITKHFMDSISIAKVLKNLETSHSTIIDVGTGAGFPGIPLKIAFPKLSVTLLDSLNKRVKFLNEVISNLELSEITALHGRAEDYGKDKNYREQFDYCVSRAVANIATLSEYCIPFVKQGGSFISYKSGKIDEELETGKKAITILGGELENTVKFQLAGTDAERSFVIIKKVKKTANMYPRKAGLPGKEPLT
ncbi:MAG: 16S rRNA (guanine(527)-N(7))-methyltransferase RsmG [Lachnospiraceae bacterium]